MLKNYYFLFLLQSSTLLIPLHAFSFMNIFQQESNFQTKYNPGIFTKRVIKMQFYQLLFLFPKCTWMRIFLIASIISFLFSHKNCPHKYQIMLHVKQQQNQCSRSKREGHISIQNLNTLNICVISLLNQIFFQFIGDVGLKNLHLNPKISPISVSFHLL